MPGPIIEFENDEQLQECLKEWVDILFLGDWTIKAELCAPHEMPEEDCDGCNHRFNTVKACKISICRKSKDDESCVLRHCEEAALVHELLHCKPWLTHYAENKGTIEGCFVEQHEHVMLDEIAKSLILAKYNLPLSWFKNF